MAFIQSVLTEDFHFLGIFSVPQVGWQLDTWRHKTDDHFDHEEEKVQLSKPTKALRGRVRA